MEDLALQPKWEVDWAASEPPWLARLRQEVAELSPKWRSYDARTLNSGSRPAIGPVERNLTVDPSRDCSPRWRGSCPLTPLAARLCRSFRL